MYVTCVTHRVQSLRHATALTEASFLWLDRRLARSSHSKPHPTSAYSSFCFIYRYPASANRGLHITLHPSTIRIMVKEDGHVGGRRGRATAQRAGLLSTKQLGSSLIHPENDGGLPTFGEPSRRKGQVKKTYGGKKPVKRRRSLSPLTSVSSESESDKGHVENAPPLSSPPPQTKPTISKINNSRTPRTPLRPGPLPSRRRADTAPSLKHVKRSASLSSLSSISDTTVDHVGWGIEDHCLAFVRIDATGNTSDDSKAVWWPAEVCLSIESVAEAHRVILPLGYRTGYAHAYHAIRPVPRFVPQRKGEGAGHPTAFLIDHSTILRQTKTTAVQCDYLLHFATSCDRLRRLPAQEAADFAIRS